MAKKHRILIVEDNPSLNDVIMKIVESEGYEADSVHTGREAIDILKKNKQLYDLILLDVMLPVPSSTDGVGIDGLEVCRLVKSDTDLADILIFMLTVKDQPEDIMKGIDAGADDYITKPFNTTLLLAKIKAMLRIKDLTNKLQEKNLLLEEMAITDGLTGIPNYRFFMEKLDEEVKRHRRYQTPFTLLLTDLDNFKEVNDTFGHRHGDFVLKEVASRLQVGLRETDLLARYGGDEFVHILTQTDYDGGMKVAQQILTRFEHPVKSGDHEHLIGLSIGLVACLGKEPMTSDEMIVGADKSLYKAKELGGNQVHSFSFSGEESI